MPSPRKEKSLKNKETSHSDLIPLKYQHLASIAVIFISLVIYFNAVIFDGKVFISGDTVAAHSFETYVNDALAQGIAPLWNPYIFCGMPAYASLTVSIPRVFDLTGIVLGKLSSFYATLMMNAEVGWVLFYYFVFGIGMYLLAYSKVKSKFIALLVALATLYSTFIIIWVTAGHVTKIAVIAFFPYILFILEKLRTRFDLKYSLVLVIMIHFLYMPSHIQLIFYSYLALGFYYLYFFVRSVILKEDWKGVVRSAVILAVASVLAFGMTADQYLSTLEYAPYSIRGSDPLVTSTTDAKGKASKGGGLDYDYATNWSFSPGETVTFLIPSCYGFGWQSYKGPLSQNQEMRLNTYFGQQPFTDAPQYMGGIILILAIIGFIRFRKDPFVQFSGILVLLSVLISYGREFPLLYDLMFNYFPYFNKFRIPSMILILAQIFIPILSGYGLMACLETNKAEQPRREKWMRYGFIAGGAVLIIAILAGDLIKSFYGFFISPDTVAKGLASSYGKLQPQVVTEFYNFISGNVLVDVIVLSLLFLIAAGSIYAFWKGSMQYTVLAVILVGVVITDLWRVNYKPYETHQKQAAKDYFKTPDYVKYIQQDTTLFRTLEFENGQPPYNNRLAYWRIQSAYGYQGAKMRRYQDLLENVSMGNPLLWSLMNVKYILSDRMDTSAFTPVIFASKERNVMLNRSFLPRAFFVQRYEQAQDADLMKRIKEMNFNPLEVAFGPDSIPAQIDPPMPEAKVEYSKFGIQDLEVKVNATGNNLIFFSETFYPVGWKAFIDGNETPIYRLNYLFRGIVVPKGGHTVTMIFEPAGFYLGKKISLLINSLVLLGLGGLLIVPFAKARMSRNTPSTLPNNSQ